MLIDFIRLTLSKDKIIDFLVKLHSTVLKY
jgi:hypothetical protein